jgi:hypothetical protein
MSIKRLAAAVLLALPIAAWGQPALDALAVQADANALPPAPAAAQSAPAASSNFCMSDLYTYQDQPVTGYELTCTNASLELVLHQTARFDQDALFSRDGRCSPKHQASIGLTSRDTKPFELDHNTADAGQSGGRRELKLYRDGEGVKSEEFLLNLTWIQEGDAYRLGYAPRTRATPAHVFKPVGGDRRSGSFVLQAAALPFNFSSAQIVNGRAPDYRDVPVDCEMTINVGDWR